VKSLLLTINAVLTEIPDFGKMPPSIKIAFSGIKELE